MIALDLDRIPPELQRLARWVCWRDEQGRKVPYDSKALNAYASSTDPATWASFDQAATAFAERRGDPDAYSGVGIVLNGDGLAGVDIDHCVNDGKPDPVAWELLNELGVAYVEISPSGTGLRAFGYAERLDSGCKGRMGHLHVELYSTGRYLTVTGCTLKTGPLVPLRGFSALAQRIRADRMTKPFTGEMDASAPDERHARLVRHVLSGDVFHDSLRDLAASMVATGMAPGAVVNHLRGLMDASQPPHDERWQARRRQIPELVESAFQKFAVHTAEDVMGRQSPPDEAPPAFAVVPVSDLALNAPDSPQFVWEGLVPCGHVTLLGAHGGTGKSTVALMLAVCVALGRPLFGIATRRGNAAFFSGEDGAALLRHRLHHVCRCMGIDVRDLDDKLFLLDATDHDPVLYAERTAAARREGMTTATFERLREYLEMHEISLLVVDNASDVYDASEIDRARVRGFMRALARVARQRNAGVLLLVHVDKGTSRGDRADREGYSGSTAWHNSARSRLFMSRDKNDALLLEHQKLNLGPKRDTLHLVWPEGGVPQVDEAFGPVMQGIADRAHEMALLRLVAEYTTRGEFVTTAITSRTHAAKLLCHEPTYPRMKDAEVFALLRQAERAGHLERVTFRGPDRKERERWQVTTAGAEFACLSAATAATSHVAAQGAPAAEPAATAATSPPGGMGEKSARVGEVESRDALDLANGERAGGSPGL